MTLETSFPEAHKRLEAWGQWQKDVLGMGWPCQSVFVAADEGTGINTRGAGLKYTPDNPEAMEIDSILTELKANKPVSYGTILKYYKTKITLHKLSKITGVSRYKLRARLLTGLEFVDKKL